MAKGNSVQLESTVVIDVARDFHGIAKVRLEKRNSKGHRIVKIGVCRPDHMGGKQPLYWYRESRLAVVGMFAVVQPAKLVAEHIHVDARSFASLEDFARFSLGKVRREGRTSPERTVEYFEERKAV